MIIGSAIKLIQADIDDEEVEWDSLLGRAYKLSFEALKRIQHIEALTAYEIQLPLPGETKD